jgi:hypothetical protein
MKCPKCESEIAPTQLKKFGVCRVCQNKQFSGGCLVCNYETNDRDELKAHNCTETMKSKSLTPERLERIKKIITENKEKDARAKREWNANECEECRQPLRDCLCEDN